MTLTEQMTELARQAKAASRQLSQLSTAEKNACLLDMAAALEQRGEALKQANAQDLQTGRQMGLSAALLDRLQLDDKRIASMAKGLREVAALPDPVGRILDERTRPNGLKLQKVSVPIGVVVIIYESRPNVTADAASLCFKSGNATILRGGKEALNSNRIIAETMVAAARRRLPNFPEHAIQVVPTTDRDAIKELLALTQYVDLCMPRGGEGLIRAVAECSKVPVIKHYKGVCHVYVDGDADLKMAEGIVINAKTQRPGVCNTMETLLVDRSIAAMFLPTMAQKLLERNVELRADPAALSLLQSPIANRQSPTTVPGLPIDNGQPPTTDPESPTANRQARIKAATEQDWDTEFLDLIMGVRVVDGVAGAVAHINQHGSAHSDSIVTANEARARQFLSEVDSAAVYWNASTRFTDGGEFGMGAEIGISTDKIGARGPMGLEELTSYKWLGFGTGQLRT